MLQSWPAGENLSKIDVMARAKFASKVHIEKVVPIDRMSAEKAPSVRHSDIIESIRSANAFDRKRVDQPVPLS